MRVSGKIIKQMGRVGIRGKMVGTMRETGKMMSLLVMELKSGEMGISTKGTS